MILVDTSVWIGFFKREPFAVSRLNACDPHDLLVVDIVLLECLRGARDERHAARMETELAQFHFEPVLNRAIAVGSARNYRRLRAIGVTPRKTVDLIIATYCIAQGRSLLHQDRDFDPMVQHLGLAVA